MRAAVWSPSASRAVQVGRYVNALLAAAGELWRFAPTILGGHKVEIDRSIARMLTGSMSGG